MAVLIALGVWWNAQTISHHFIHRPFFRRAAANHLVAAALSVALGVPQSLWRDRHLAHHAGRQRRLTLSPEICLQAALVVLFWALMAARAPAFFAAAYVPGYLTGLALCAVHGHYEHAGGVTSHYGAIYNALLLNDGYHAEHHAHPGVPWRLLPQHRAREARVSAWPAPLRWLERCGLDGLERIVLRSAALQRVVVAAHERAFRRLAAALPARLERIAIVGGGLFPRSYLALSRVFPDARFTIIDASAPNLARARAFVDPRHVALVHELFGVDGRDGYDLIVIPLSFDGDRRGIYAHPPAPIVAVHDWIWRKRGDSRIVSAALLKRINVVRACGRLA